MKELKTAVVGGGITGLSAAYFLQKHIEKKEAGSFALYEAGDRLGGTIQTEHRDGYVIERGPDSFLTRKRSLHRLAVDLGMEEDLTTNKSGSYIYHGGKLHRIPQGAVMGIPTEWKPFLTTGLFSPIGKLRAAMDLFIPRRKSSDDISVDAFFRRRLGSEVVDHMIEPLLSGIYAGRLNELSLKATFPQFLELENKRRSLILGMKQSLQKTVPEDPVLIGESRSPANMFLTFRSGLSSLVDNLQSALPPESIHLKKRLEKLERSESGYSLFFSDGTVDHADRVLLTIRHDDAAALFQDEPFMDSMPEQSATSVATCALAFDESQIKDKLDGTGFLVPRSQSFTMTACTWTHQKWEHTAPKGKALLRAYVGRAGDEAIVSQDDQNISDTVLRDLKQIMTIEGDPEFSVITRWKRAMPQYNVGHSEALTKLEEGLSKRYPGVLLLGASFRGIGLPDCVTQAEKAVSKLLQEK
ncbi:protoporphyrinogen oxidase [Alkalicoccus luteus]|uniref:Coproporphyrinogen III oxidase n=1 Tax=Alkalicoccus luteus TaxID=1237094 RepID=A0A969PPH8_9BACI|nr:protoporphyrinogen oxidase [Alkalicoccus luteus]NJP36584.1 protoporphyrinogen oxidase [Alkalicoccus luteus]